jgi:amidase
MPDPEVWSWSAGEIVARVTARQVSVSEVAVAFLRRVEDINPKLNAICTVTADRALAAAARADARLAAGHLARPLEGVPYTVKDNIPVAGVRCTYGSRLFTDHVAGTDAISVQRLEESGAVLLGKTNLPEMADDPFCNTTNAVFGQTRNPWDVNRTPGASSGGGAAATAAGAAPLALGTDWGGSVRGPAAFCGVVGFRASAGRIPARPDLNRLGYARDLPVEDAQGPITATVADAIRATAVLIGGSDQGPSAGRFTSGPSAGEFAAALAMPPDLRGRRVAFSPDYGGIAPVEPELADCARAAAELLASLGCEVTEAAPDFRDVRTVIAGLRPLGVGLRFGGYRAAELDQLNPRLAGAIQAALQVDVATVARAGRLRSRLQAEYDRFMTGFDFLVSPTWGAIPFRVDVPFEYQIAGRPTPDYFDHILLTYAISVVGAPAVSVPAGLSRAGLPAGVQIAGARMADRDVLTAALAYELARGPLPAPPELSRQDVCPADPMFLADQGSVAWRSPPLAGPG